MCASAVSNIYNALERLLFCIYTKYITGRRTRILEKTSCVSDVQVSSVTTENPTLPTDMTNPELTPPKDKHDFDSLDRLAAADPTEWRHLVPDLVLDWVYINSSIFTRVIDVLLRNHGACIEPLRNQYGEGDIETHIYCLSLIGRMPQSTKARL